MESKTEIRHTPDQPVRLNVLGDAPRACSARLLTLQGRKAVIRTETCLRNGEAVRIDLEDSMLLGEITGCSLDSSAFTAQVEVVEAIPSLSDLARLVAAVMNEGRSESRDRQTAKAAAAR